jgi:hypothetical protein
MWVATLSKPCLPQSSQGQTPQSSKGSGVISVLINVSGEGVAEGTYVKFRVLDVTAF